MPGKQGKQEKLHFAVLAVDVVLFRLHEGELEVLLAPVTNRHFKGQDAAVGGIIEPKETAEEAVVRHLKNKGGIEGAYFEQLYTFSQLDRDPRGRVVSVAHLAIVTPDHKKTNDDAYWHPVAKLDTLAYDHNLVIGVALKRLRSKLAYTTIVRHFLPSTFTLTDIQNAYESILGRELDKRNFRKKIQAEDVLVKTDKMTSGGANRPAALYKWKSSKQTKANMLWTK